MGFRLLRLILLGLMGCMGMRGVLATPVIQHWETENGASVYFVAAPELPMVDVRLVFAAGSSRDGDKPGLANLTNDLLADGAGDLNADQIAERFESLGAQFGTESLRDMAIVNLRSLTDPELLEPAIGTLARVLSQPSFTQEDLERERQRMLVALRQQEQSPGDLGSKRFYAEVFAGHPYASPPEGTEASLKALTRQDLRRFHQRYYVARNAQVVIVGALDRSQARTLAERAVGELPAGQPAPPIEKVKDLPAGQTVSIPYASSQSHVLIGQPGMARGDPDYFTLYVGNHILGGAGLVSRLTQEVREKRGLSYSVYSYFAPMQRRGPWVMGLQTRNDQLAEALTVMRETLRTFIAQGPTQKELEEAKQNITGSFALKIDSNRDIAEYVAMIGFYRLPLDYLDTFNQKIEAVTVQEVRDAFQRRLHPEKMVTVVVGGL
jgi:zinc protease